MASTPTPSGSASSGGLRGKILLLVLGLLVVALIYDFAVARPAVEKAYATVEAENSQFNAKRQHQAMVDRDIHEILDRQPSRTFDDGGMLVEVYSWRAGLPFRTHDLFVVYRPVQGTNYFAHLTKFVHDRNDAFQAESMGGPSTEEEVGEMSESATSGGAPWQANGAEAEAADRASESEATGSEAEAANRPEVADAEPSGEEASEADEAAEE